MVSERRPRGSFEILPAIEESFGAKRQYSRLLNQFLRQIAASYRRSVIPALQTHRRFTSDEEAWFIALEAEADTFEQDVLLGVGGIIASEIQSHTREFVLIVQQSLSVDLAAVVRNEDLDDFLRDAVSRNAALIKSLRQDAIKDIRRIIFDAKISGRGVAAIAREIRDRFNVHASRAQLIAEDQINKLNADLNRIRQQQAGVTRYSWRTSRDERVRTLHRSLDNTIYRWGERTGAEAGLPPGQPVRCRCSARAVVTF